ncbi:MAG: argininosuccinate lyase, partial [Bacillota bacterium]
MKAWGGRFEKSADPGAEGFTSSLSFDRALYKQDIAGSIAHARMLAARGIISPAEMERIVSGLNEILLEIEEGRFDFRIADEDIHLNIERRLIEKIGDAGGKLHTARSRNDQVALDTRLYTIDRISAVKSGIACLQRSIVQVSRAHPSAVMPGYTHLQRAQPVLFAHHLMAYFWMLLRDYQRFSDCGTRAAVSLLGACALAGTTHDIAPQMTAG